jgi:hypothetical protein
VEKFIISAAITGGMTVPGQSEAIPTAVLIRVDPAANSQRGRTNLQYLQA